MARKKGLISKALEHFDLPTPRNRSGDSGGDGKKDGDKRPPLPRDEQGRPIVDRKDPEQMRQLFEESDRDENGRIPKDQLPKGWDYDTNGTLHDEKGHKTGHPDEINRDLRKKYYPDGFSPETHRAMVQRYTEQGRQPEGTTGTIPSMEVPDGKQPAASTKVAPEIQYKIENGVPVDTSTGRPVPRDRLTWNDDKGETIPYYREGSKGWVTNLQYDHKTPAAQHWNEHGHNQSYAERKAWYDNPDNLVPMDSKQNAGKGSSDTGGERHAYTEPPGEGYTAKPGKE